jgi:DNA-binding transcriptional MerR regulator
MDLIRINEVAETFGISSRTLRYYEQVGILWSEHPGSKAQRYYDSDALERLKQILVLRKLQIPIKDIVEIFKSESITALIQAFISKLGALDSEISALSELRKIVDEFLHDMLMSGIKKISAVTLLYEETEKRLVSQGKKEPVTFEELSKISRKALKLHDVRIINLPPMRVLTSRKKAGGAEELDADKMENLFKDYGFIALPGLRNCFFRREPGDEWIMLMKIPDDFENATIYEDEGFTGGLFAVASSFMENLDDTSALLKDWIDKSEHFELDTNGNLRVHEMIEEILPWDIANKLGRYQQDIFISIRMKNKEKSTNE